MPKRLLSLLLTLCLALPLSACGQQASGSELNVCVGDAFHTLDPIYAQDSSSHTILAHLYENLMRVTADGTDTAVTTGMAKSVETQENADGTVTYTFQLRTARWSDGEKVTAGDFVYAWRRLVDPGTYSPNAPMLSVVSGYREVRESGDPSLLQVEAKSDSVLQVNLDGNYDWFLREVCTSPVTVPLRQDVVRRLKEENANQEGNLWWSVPSSLVTNGPYSAGEYAPGSHLILSRNERYQTSRTGPDRIAFYFASTAEEAQTLYEQGAVDAVWPLTEERFTQLSGTAGWEPLPLLETYTVVYNGDHELLGDVLIRRAFELALDRNALAAEVGVTGLAAEGVVPPGVPENEEGDFRSAGGPLLENDPETYPERCQAARDVLNEAGYSSGSDLGELEYLYVEDGVTGKVALALTDMWREVLGVTVTARAVTETDLRAALELGEFALAGVKLEALGNDAECFLMSWTSDSQDNWAQYESSAYDTLMSIVATTADGTARMGCLHDAEALLLEDCALSPLYTRSTAWELRDSLTGACRDARGWFSFAGVTAKSTT